MLEPARAFRQLHSAHAIISLFALCCFAEISNVSLTYSERVMGIRDACNSGPGVCFHGSYDRMCDVNPTLTRRNFQVLIWNAGLHFMHLQPLRTGLSEVEYELRLRRCGERLGALFPKAIRIYKHTNQICSERFTGAYATSVALWKQRSIQDEMFSMQFDEIGAATVVAIESKSLSDSGWSLMATGTHVQLPRRSHGLVNSSRFSARSSAAEGGVCSCTGMQDGRHYVPIIPHFVLRLSERIQTALRATPRAMGQRN